MMRGLGADASYGGEKWLNLICPSLIIGTSPFQVFLYCHARGPAPTFLEMQKLTPTSLQLSVSFIKWPELLHESITTKGRKTSWQQLNDQTSFYTFHRPRIKTKRWNSNFDLNGIDGEPNRPSPFALDFPRAPTSLHEPFKPPS